MKNENFGLKNIIQNLEKNVEEINENTFLSNENFFKTQYETSPLSIQLNDIDAPDEEKVIVRRASKLNVYTLMINIE